MILLDTHVVSELMKAAPSVRVRAWVSKQSPGSLFTTSVTQAEILYGVRLLPSGRRRKALEVAVEGMFREGMAEKYIQEVPKYEDKVIECAKEVCRYIHRVHGRFPAHCDAMYFPGIWLQVHYVNVEYYDFLFQNALTDAQRSHQQWWQPDLKEHLESQVAQEAMESLALNQLPDQVR